MNFFIKLNKNDVTKQKKMKLLEFQTTFQGNKNMDVDRKRSFQEQGFKFC